MSEGSIKTTQIVVDVQENGIIRRADTGYLIGRLASDYDYEQLTRVGNMQHTTKYPTDLSSGTPGNINRVPVATPAEIAHRIYITAEQIRVELSQIQSYTGAIDKLAMAAPHINKSLWSIKHGATALVGILAGLDGGDK